MLRNFSPLDDETEKYVAEVIDCGVIVHRVLGPGFIEPTYLNAMCLEFVSRGIPFETEKRYVVTYRNRPVALHRCDLVVRGRVLIELKAVSVLEPVHHAQVLAYLKASKLRVGLLMNFGGVTLKAGLRRIIL
jgi:GxxExxY protein